jgi:Skp family chaperone for outer membrane proteins
VNRTVGFVIGASALALGVFLGGYVWAQQGTRPAAPLQTRIAVVNLAQVIKNYNKYKQFELDIKQQSQQIQHDLDTKKAQVLGDQKELENPQLAADRRGQLEHHMKALQREMQDSVEEAKQRISQQEFTQLVQTYKEIKDAVDRFARAYGIELIMQYSDAVGSEVYAQGHFQHKLANRACIPMYIAPGMDITDQVTNMLNQNLASNAAPVPRGN